MDGFRGFGFGSCGCASAHLLLRWHDSGDLRGTQHAPLSIDSGFRKTVMGGGGSTSGCSGGNSLFSVIPVSCYGSCHSANRVISTHCKSVDGGGIIPSRDRLRSTSRQTDPPLRAPGIDPPSIATSSPDPRPTRLIHFLSDGGSNAGLWPAFLEGKPHSVVTTRAVSTSNGTVRVDSVSAAPSAACV